MYLEAPRHSPVRLPRTRLTGSSAPTLTNIFVHSGSMASRNLHLAECLPAMVGDLHVLLHLGVRQGRLAFLASLCLEPLLQGLPQPVLHENRGPVRRRGNVGRGVVLEGVRDVEVVLPACDLLLDEGLLLALVDLATLDLGQHELVQANVPAAFAEELLIQVRTLAGGRLQDQLGEARALVQIEERLPARVRVHYENHPCFAFAHLAVGYRASSGKRFRSERIGCKAQYGLVLIFTRTPTKGPASSTRRS